MFRSMYVNHTISALSHFHNDDLPLPFSNTDFYINIIRNLFANKNSCEIVEVGFVYDFSRDKSYMAVIVTPKVHVKINTIINIKDFITWFNSHFAELMFKHEYITNNDKSTTYAYNDGYYRYSVVITESLDNSESDQILIEYKTLN